MKQLPFGIALPEERSSVGADKISAIPADSDGTDVTSYRSARYRRCNHHNDNDCELSAHPFLDALLSRRRSGTDVTISNVLTARRCCKTTAKHVNTGPLRVIESV